MEDQLLLLRLEFLRLGPELLGLGIEPDEVLCCVLALVASGLELGQLFLGPVALVIEVRAQPIANLLYLFEIPERLLALEPCGFHLD